MEDARWTRVRALFEQALDQPDDARAAWLAAECGDDVALRDEVAALLAADAPELDTARIASAPDLVSDYAARAGTAEAQAQAGRRFGAYRIASELGRGGMGAVYLARRDDGQFEGEVAIKLIRGGWDTIELERRFASERRILAQLDHPNIARLLDAGIDPDGGPFLVLEYVRGEHLLAFCDAARLPLAARLELFVSICAAVSHAHERLVVHRDLKPSNILVTAGAQAKLLDFGVAKLIGGDDGEQTRTATHARMFTPEFAAPEQIRGLPVTTAVDVYALGMVLCHLVCGGRPYKPEADTAAAIERAILDQEPLRPSALVTRSDPDAAARAASARATTTARLRGALRGDLDAIVLKALRKQPEHRYASVRDLADDVRRHLDRRPVRARQGDSRYRMARFVRRHALAVALSAAAVVSLFAGLGIALWQAHEARVQRDIARDEAEKSREALDFIGGVFALADPGESRGAQVTARELLEKGATRIRGQTRLQADARAELLGVLGRSYGGLGLYPQAVALHEEAVALRRPAGGPALGAAQLDLGKALSLAGRSADAIAPLTEAERLLAATPETGELRAAAATVAIASAQQATGKLAEADATFLRALERIERAGASGSAQHVQALAQRTNILVLRDDFPAADAVSAQALALATRLPEDEPARLVAMKSRATALQNLDRDAEAEPIRRAILERTERIYGAEHPSTASALNDVASAAYNQKRYAEAAPLFERVVDLRRKLSGPDNPSLATAINNLAGVRISMRQPAEAEALYREALAIRRAKFGPSHYAVSLTLAGLGVAESQQGRFEPAAKTLEEALAVALQSAPENKQLALGPLSELALVYLDLPGRDADCGLAREASTMRDALDAAGGDPNGRAAMARAVLGVCLIEHGERVRGRELVDASLDKARAGFGADNSRIKVIERHLAARQHL